MPKRTDIKKIMIIGSGPIIIGQAGEFDYSGTQAVKALKEEGYETILVNSNPATIMTDPEIADKVYIEPLTPAYLTEIIKKERPDALLPTVGGQTALNLALTLYNNGTLKEYGIEMIGANAQAIKKAEDRKLFKEAMNNINLRVAKSGLAHTLEEAREVIKTVGFPTILRPSFTLGGTGGGICYKEEDFDTMILKALDASPNSQVLVEESIIGWKEYELEVMRDFADNVVIICSIENLDPMGVHTGDSITVAPQQTLTDKEYQNLRDMSIKIIREIGVETGGSNIQFAVNPRNGEVIVIEMNPRVSRSSALASKATGFAIARIAAKLSVGYLLPEIQNEITKKTPASFEPSIDYIVTKIPRFNFEKFPDSSRTLDTQMRSVGEAMAIGRTFLESFQKAMRSLETKRYGFGADGHIDISLNVLNHFEDGSLQALWDRVLVIPTDERIFYVREALSYNLSVDYVYQLTNIDPWFLNQFQKMLEFERKFIKDYSKNFNFDMILQAKEMGYADRQIAVLILDKEFKQLLKDLLKVKKSSKTYLSLIDTFNKQCLAVEQETLMFRKKNKIEAVFKRIDTCAAEFESNTPYLYSTFEEECEADVSDKNKVIILGGGPNRIGQGIEFDYCCCHASFALQEMNFESIMINSNPETVSTDYDSSDRLYFEPLSIENILRIYEVEQQKGNLLGAIIQFGGQTPLSLAKKLSENGVTILGTSPNDIDRAEDRRLFNELIQKLQLRQPNGKTVVSTEEAIIAANEISYPVLVRPSYVLGGRAMLIVYNDEQLVNYMEKATEVSPDSPILIDAFLQNAIEIDVDALCDQTDVVVAGIMEHIEQAGVHSGDSACILPPKSLSNETIQEIKDTTKKLALELNVKGLINIQFALQNNILYVLEVNPRASRTSPFVSKAIGVAIAKMATYIIMGHKLVDLLKKPYFNIVTPDLYYVKEVVLPFKKFAGSDIILGPEMKSTGEVMGIGKTPSEAFLKAQEAVGFSLPRTGSIFISVNNESKPHLVDLVAQLIKKGYHIIATEGTANFFISKGLQVEVTKKVNQGSMDIINAISTGKIHCILNIPLDQVSRDDAFDIRINAIKYNIPYFTTLAAALEAFTGLAQEYPTTLSIYPIQKK